MKIKMDNKSNHFFGISTNIIVMLSPIIVIPFIISSVGLEKYGEFVQVNIVYSCLISILIASLAGYFVKSFIEKKLTILDIFIVQIIISSFAGGGILFFIFLTKSNYYSLFFILAILSNSINFEWFFHATGAQKDLFYRTVTIKVLYIITTIILMECYPRIELYYIIYALNISITNIVIGLYCYKKNRNFSENYEITYNKFKYILVDAKYFVFNPLIGAFYQYGDQILVGVLFSKSSLVFVNLAKQIIGAAVMVSGTLCRVEQKNIFNLPVGSRIIRIKKIMLFYVSYLSLSSLIIILLGPILLGYVINGASNLNYSYYILIAGVFIFTSLSIFMDSIFGLVYRKEHFTLVANMVCATVVTGLNVLFLKENGANFSLLSLLLGEAIVFIMLLAMHTNNMKKVCSL